MVKGHPLVSYPFVSIPSVMDHPGRSVRRMAASVALNGWSLGIGPSGQGEPVRGGLTGALLERDLEEAQVAVARLHELGLHFAREPFGHHLDGGVGDREEGDVAGREEVAVLAEDIDSSLRREYNLVL